MRWYTSVLGLILLAQAAQGGAPDGRPGWRQTSEGEWVNDRTHERYVPGTLPPPVPALGPQTYAASFASDTEGWASIGGQAPGSPDGSTIEASAWTPNGYAGGGFVSRGPWWLDTNQGRSDQGAGLHLVAYLWSRALLPGVHYHRIDFRDAELTFWLRGQGIELAGSHLVVWVQARGKDKAANWALTSQPLDRELLAGDWQPVRRTLVADPAQWTCLDALNARPDMYACAPLEAVLGDVNADWGLLLYPVPGVGAILPSGAIELDELRLQYRLTPRD